MENKENNKNNGNLISPFRGLGGRRFGQTILLKPEGADAYVKYHAEAWPGVLKMISECNIQNYSIFKKDLMLFAYFEYVGTDFDGDMAKMAADPETQRWWDVVKPLMQPIETRKEGEFWADMEEIFHLSPALSKGEGERTKTSPQPSPVERESAEN